MKKILILFIFFIFSCSDNNIKVDKNITKYCEDFNLFITGDIRLDSGNLYFVESNYESALEVYEEVLEESIQKDDRPKQLLLLENIGLVYLKMDNLEKAEEYFIEARKKNEFIQDDILRKNLKFYTINLESFGALKKAEKKYNESIDYFEQALKIYVDCNQVLRVVSCLNHLGMNYYYKNNYNLSLEYFFKASKLCLEYKYKQPLALSFYFIGQIYFEQKDYMKALDYYLSALTIDKQLDRRINIGDDLIRVGNTYLKLNNLLKAEHYFNRSEETLKSLKKENENEIVGKKIENLLIELKNFQEQLKDIK